MTETKQEYFDGIAGQWDSFDGPPLAAEQQRAFVRLATEHGPSRILDVGCGTGVLVPYIRQHSPAASLVELDFSREMLAVNRDKHGDQIEYRCCEFTAASFAHASFDCILCFNALPHMPIDTAIAKFSELLQARGRLAICHLMGSAELNAFHASMRGPVARDVLPHSAEVSSRLQRSGLRVLLCEERPDWYCILAGKAGA